MATAARTKAARKSPTATTKARTAASASSRIERDPVLGFDDAAAWNAWLAENHATSTGLWLKLRKKAKGASALTYAEAVDEALVYGWIDGQKRAFDDAAWLQRFSPRGARSIWSKINRDKADALIASGRMMPAGLAQVERARGDGRLDAAYDGAKNMSVPEDLEAALAKNARAKAFFATLDSANRYAVLFRIHNVKRAETRARKIETFVAMLAKHEKIHGG